MSKKTYNPESLAHEFDLLMARAGMRPPTDLRDQMLLEFTQMRAEIDIIHAKANAHPGNVDLRRAITEGRVEE